MLILYRVALTLAESEVTKFLENPAVLIGIPMVALGALGLVLLLLPVPEGGPVPPGQASEAALQLPPGAVEGHVSPETYIKVGLILAGVTAIEVAIYYMDVTQGLLTAALLALSLMKFLLVVLWFMHLRFDSRLFSILFAGGLMLVLALFTVVLASLGASLA